MWKFITVALLAAFAQQSLAAWKYTTTKDAMSNLVESSAALDSPTSFKLSFPYEGGTNGRLYIYFHGKDRNLPRQVAFHINRGQIVNSEGIDIRFDEEETVRFETYGRSDGSALSAIFDFPGMIVGCTPERVQSLPGENDSGWTARYHASQAACKMTIQQFIKRLSKSTKIRVDTTLYHAGSRVFEFNPTGLKWMETVTDSGTATPGDPISQDQEKPASPSTSLTTEGLAARAVDATNAISMTAKPKLGVNMIDLPPVVAATIQRPNFKGVLITAVMQGSVAEKAGLKVGDVLYSFDRKSVSNITDLQAVVASTASRLPVEIKIIRGITEMDLSASFLTAN